MKGISFALPALRAWPGQLSMMALNASLIMFLSDPAHALLFSAQQQFEHQSSNLNTKACQ